MNKLLFFIAFFVSIMVSAHDINFARFDIKRENDQTLLIIRLDRENLLEAIKSDCDDYNNIQECFSTYIRAHFALEINDEKVRLSHLSHEFLEDMIELRFELHHDLQWVKTIGVYNDTLIEKKSNQENIVSVILNEKKRSFRMNKDRIRTVIEY